MDIQNTWNKMYDIHDKITEHLVQNGWVVCGGGCGDRYFTDARLIDATKQNERCQLLEVITLCGDSPDIIYPKKITIKWCESEKVWVIHKKESQIFDEDNINEFDFAKFKENFENLKQQINKIINQIKKEK